MPSLNELASFRYNQIATKFAVPDEHQTWIEKDGKKVAADMHAIELAGALSKAKSQEERDALVKRHSTRLYAEEMALARCNKSFEAYSRCIDTSFSKTACFAPLEHFAMCTRQASRRMQTNCANRFAKFQESYEGGNPDWSVYLNDLTRCMINKPSNLPEYADTEAGFKQKAKEYTAFRKTVLGDNEYECPVKLD